MALATPHLARWTSFRHDDPKPAHSRSHKQTHICLDIHPQPRWTYAVQSTNEGSVHTEWMFICLNVHMPVHRPMPFIQQMSCLVALWPLVQVVPASPPAPCPRTSMQPLCPLPATPHSRAQVHARAMPLSTCCLAHTWCLSCTFAGIPVALCHLFFWADHP